VNVILALLGALMPSLSRMEPPPFARGAAASSALASTLWISDDRSEWAELFADLARLERLDRSSRAFRELSSSLASTATTRERQARKAKDEVSQLRARVLEFHVQRLSGVPTRNAYATGFDVDWLPGEAWYAARAQNPCVTRGLAFEAAVKESDGQNGERTVLAALAADDDFLHLRLDSAERIARAIHDRRNTAESAGRLVRILCVRGGHAEARALLDRGLAVAPNDAQRGRLLCERARVSRGQRLDLDALHDLGAALAAGSDEASLALAEGALARGETGPARHLSQALLADDPAREDALELWGIALLSPIAAPTRAPGKLP
jgi:hypothetical protein